MYQAKHPKLFNLITIYQFKTAHPRIWWELNGGATPILKRIGVRMLSQPCSSSACERNWSAFDAAQTEKRCRLLPETLEDLVYVRMNSLMMMKSEENELADSKPINLDDIGDLPEMVDDGREELYEDEAEATEHNQDTDVSWLERVLARGQ